MSETWVYDGGNPYEDAFEDSLLIDASASLMSDVIVRTLLQIREDPRRGTPALIEGETVYIVKTSAITTSSGVVPPLLIAYALETKERLIRPILVCRASDADVIGSLQSAIDNAPARSRAFKRRVLRPAERTSIPKRAIESAVKRVLKRNRHP